MTVGDELSGEIASYTAGEAHDDQGNIIAGESLVAADADGDLVEAGDVIAVSAGNEEKKTEDEG